MSEKLIGLKQVKVVPLYNLNFEISNKDELQNLISGIPIVKDDGIHIRYGASSRKLSPEYWTINSIYYSSESRSD